MPETLDVGSQRLLDLHLPTGKPVGLLTWCHGSAFRADNGRDGADEVAAVFNRFGIAVAGIAIRPSSQAIYPAQRDDIADALAFLHDRGFDRIVTAGESSGGWAAAMGGLTTDLVRGVVAFYPPCDFLTMDAQRLPHGMVHDDPGSPESQLVGAPIQEVPEHTRAASPIAHVHPAAPPFLLVHGSEDPLVPVAQSATFAAELSAHGVEARFVEVPGAGHGMWRDWISRSDVQEFVTARLR